MPSFSQSSKDKLNTCHPDLQKLFYAVIRERDCTVLEGARTLERQGQLVAEGKSQTLNSRHIPHEDGYSRAVDVMPYPIDWNDKERMKEFAIFVYNTAMKLNIRVTWGGSWKTFFDGPHWELI